MKKILIIAILLLFSLPSFGEPPYGITSVTATPASGGINISVNVLDGGAIGFVGYSYTVVDNIVELDICYYPYPFPKETALSNDFFIPVTQANDYNINVTANFSSSQEICQDNKFWDFLSVTVLSAQEYGIVDNLKIFPNPVHDILKLLNVNSTDISSITIYNALGGGVLSDRASHAENNSIDMTTLSDGIYIVRVRMKDGSAINKQVVKI